MLLAVGLLLVATAFAQDFDAAAKEFARRIEVTGRRSENAPLTVRNASSLPETVVAQVRRELEKQRVTAQITLSENIHSYLWVAVVKDDVVMMPVARPAALAAAPTVVSIQKKLLWEQERPILDAAVSGGYLIVLDPSAVSFYRERQLVRAFPVPAARPVSRDPRGRLSINNDSFRALLPGAICNGTVAPALDAVCAESRGWPLEPGRNYFSEPGLPPYYSSAQLTEGKLIAGLDGRARLFDTSGRETAQWSGWGSDITTIETDCGSGPFVLASKPDDGPADALQLHTVGPAALPLGEPAVFPGPVVALWPSGQKGEAVAVTRNSETGRYAAYSLATTCNR